jgi:hypothetical protein
MRDLPYVPLTKSQRDYLRGKENVIHWKGGNVVFMFQGKCANTALKAAILEAEGGIDTSINVHADPRITYVSRDYVAGLSREIPVIGFVRKPYDRLMAFWRDKVAGRTSETMTSSYLPAGVYPDMSFAEFATCVCMAPPIRGDLASAHDTMDFNGRLLPWQVFRFEDLITSDGWTRVKRWTAKAWDLPAVFPHYNRPRVPRPELDAGAERKLRALCFSAYYRDYERFGWRAYDGPATYPYASPRDRRA